MVGPVHRPTAWMPALLGLLLALLLCPVALGVNHTDPQAVANGINDPNTTNATWEGENPLEAPEQLQASPLVGLGALLVATVVLGAALWLNRRLRDNLDARLARWEPVRQRELRLGRLWVRSATWLQGLARGAIDALQAAVAVLLLVIYIPFSMSLFEPTRPLARRLVALAQANLAAFGRALSGYLPDLVFIVLIGLVAWAGLRALRWGFEEIAAGRMTLKGFYPSWGKPTYTLVRFVVLAFVLVLILPRLPGFGSEAFQGISLFIGALVALGASSAMANVVSGTVLTYTRAFSVGDRVQIAETLGDVVERSLLVTRIRTIKNEDITIPNAQVLSHHIVNYSGLSKERALIIGTTVSIGYEVPWRQVHELLIQAAGATDGVLDDPAPFVLQKELGDFSVVYEVNVYTELPSSQARLRSLLHQSIQDAFQEAGVEILSPMHQVRHQPPEPSAPGTPARPADEEVSVDLDEDAGTESRPAEEAQAEEAEEAARVDAEAEEAWEEQEDGAGDEA